MILIIGGSHQGKRMVAMEHSNVKNEMVFRSRCAEGLADSFESAMQRPYIIGYHHYIRRLVEQREDSIYFTEQIIAAMPEIIVMDEVGCGIVPMEPQERQYREAVGIAGQMLAKASSEVYRVVCGIPVRLR